MDNRYELNKELAQMLKGGVIMDVTTPQQAQIAQETGACAVMALERIPADIRAVGGVSRMSDPKMIQEIQNAVSIPVMAKCRIGHFVEAQILEAIEIDYIDESEVLSPADDVYHIDKRTFRVPFVCGARDLGEALRRIQEGASMIRTKGEPGTGDVVQAVRHMRMMNRQIASICAMREDELYEAAKEFQVPFELVKNVHDNGRLPVVNFAAGGIATPADAALMMQLGAETFEIRKREDLETQPMDGLVLPGGESTAMGKLLRELDLFFPLKEKIEGGLPVLATCAGMILLAEKLTDGETPHFTTMPICVRRNAYGRQLGSFETDGNMKGIGTIPMVFIRAPYVESAAGQVEILAETGGRITAVRYQNQLAMAFHPELTEDNRVYEYWLRGIAESA